MEGVGPTCCWRVVQTLTHLSLVRAPVAVNTCTLHQFHHHLSHTASNASWKCLNQKNHIFSVNNVTFLISFTNTVTCTNASCFSSNFSIHRIQFSIALAIVVKMLPPWRLSGGWWYGPRGLCLNTNVVALDKFATYELHWIAYCYTIDMRSVKCLMSWPCQLLHEKALNTSQIHLTNLF